MKASNHGAGQLKGKIALVTGASRGLGKAIALEFARQGAITVINFRNNVRQAAISLREISRYAEASMYKADVSNIRDVKRLIAYVERTYGALDILVNNAGLIRDRTLGKMSFDEWDEVMQVNLNSVFYVTREASRLLNKDGRVINISSVVGLDGNFGQTNYAAAKAGIIGFTRSLSKELAKKGITVNAVAPGLMETESSGLLPEAAVRAIRKRIPLNRLGLPREVAKLAAFLCSADAGYITGQVIRIDGGLVL